MTKKSIRPKMSRLTPAKSSRTHRNAAKRLATALRAGKADPFLDALEEMVRAKGAARVAKKAGVSRKSMAAAFSPKGRAEFAAFLDAVQAAGLKLSVRADAA